MQSYLLNPVNSEKRNSKPVSMCHPETGEVSCGACCGFLNLDLEIGELRQLLQERTQEFQRTVDFSVPHTIPRYRQSRESLESQIPKKEETIYNCPFLGFLEKNSRKIGCMIHPSRTGDPLSQNYSFYGASICLGYECKNKERHTEEFWIGFFQKLSQDSFTYSRFSANHPWVRRIENALKIPPTPPKSISEKNWKQNSLRTLAENEEKIRKVWEAIYSVYVLELKNSSSFEIDYDTNESSEESRRILSQLLGSEF